MPAAYAANANLFVSAENSQFDNYMSGPQVIEVVVIDSDINDTDEAKGEPDVTVNGKILRMIQAVDGNWYGYFADRDQAMIADSTTDNSGAGLDFGGFCAASTGTTVMGFSLEDTDGYTIGNLTSTGNELQPTAAATLTTTNANCDGTGAADGTEGSFINVVREAKDPNDGSATNVDPGQIGILEDSVGNAENWPFIQLYEFNPTGNVVIQYNKGGGVQSTTLTFDTVDQYAELSLDRDLYPRLSQVHVTITDLWLNIDPTDEDSWTFAANSAANSSNVDTFYQVFDENGASGGSALTLSSTLDSLMCEDNCVLKLNVDAQSSGTPVATLQDNGDTVLAQLNSTGGVNNASAFGVAAATDVLGTGSYPVTFTEQGPNSGVFGTYDESDVSVLKITSDAKRGTSASIDYNETPQTILVGFDFATIDIQPIDDEWTSGEEIPVVVVDADQNKNSRADEDLDVNNPDVTLIPALSTGDPFTIGEGGTPAVVLTNGTLFAAGSSDAPLKYNIFQSGSTVSNFTLALNITGYTSQTNVTSTESVDTFSERLILSQTANTSTNVAYAIVDLKTTMEVLKETVVDEDNTAVGFNFFNYDVRSFGADTVSIALLNTTQASGFEDGWANNDTYNVSTDRANAILLVSNATKQIGYVDLANAVSDAIYGDVTNDDDDVNLGYALYFTGVSDLAAKEVMVLDFFSFGFTDDGVQSSERFANQIIRIEAEETGDNTSTFEGSLEYVMVNQINIQDADTFAGITPIADDPSFIVIEDLTD
jgi:hypothetical protein